MNQRSSQEVYVMRLWHEHSSDAWRVTITDTRNQEKFHFASLESLFRFFKGKIEDSSQVVIEPLT